MNLGFLPLIFMLLFFFAGPSDCCAKNDTLTTQGENALLLGSVLLTSKHWQEQGRLTQWTQVTRKASATIRRRGNIEAALILLDHCINPRWCAPKTKEEQLQVAWSYVSRGYIHNDLQGNYLAAKHDLLCARSTFLAYDFEDDRVARFVLQPLGNIHTRHAENEQAIILLRRFHEIAKANDDTAVLLASYNDLARAYLNKGSYAEAIALLEQGILVATNDVPNLGLLYLSKAEAHLQLNELEYGITAAKLSRNFLKQELQTLSKDSPRYKVVGGYLIGLDIIFGELETKRNNYPAALRHYKAALQDAPKFYPGKHRRISKLHIGLANALTHFGESERALKHYQLSLISSIQEFDDTTVEVNPKARQLYAEVSIGEAFVGKARAAEQAYIQTKDLHWLKLAAKTYASYFQWDNLLRAEHLHDKSKLEFLTEIHAAGEEALEVLYTLHQLEPDSNWPRIAFNILEQTKGVVLAESRFKTFQRIPGVKSDLEIDTLNKARALRSVLKIKLNHPETQLDQEMSERLSNYIDSVDQRIELLLFNIKQRYKGYDISTLQDENALEFGTVTAYLDSKKSDLLSYFVGKSKMYVIAIHNKEVFFEELDRHLAISLTNELIEDLRNPGNSTAANYATLAKQVYNALIGDLDTKLTNANWLILPDNNLNSLPFEALVAKELTSTPSFKTFPYLLHDRTTFYAPSMKFVLRASKESESQLPFLGIAPVFKNSQTYAYLKHSEHEVNLGKNAFGGEVLLHDSATKERFLRRISDFQIIHISTHSGSGSGVDNDAWMAFHPDAQAHDKLFTPELFQVSLAANLVILNACETGSGTYYSGEGVLSMTRGFADAGAASVITNLWQVNHVSNAVILKEFYSALQNVKTPHEALTEAKKSYLKNDKTDNNSAHPFYWAAPVLIGTGAKFDMPVQPSELPTNTATAIVILLLLAAYIFYRRFVHKPL